MHKVERSRVMRETLPEKRVRSAPRVLIPENQIAVTLLVTTEVVHGTVVSEEELAAWVQEAIVAYHRFRNGWVGVGARGSITLPKAIIADDS